MVKLWEHLHEHYYDLYVHFLAISLYSMVCMDHVAVETGLVEGHSHTHHHQHDKTTDTYEINSNTITQYLSLI